jgi:hypothetical protein
MADFQYVLSKLLLLSEVAAGIVGVIKLKKFKDTHWKWFIYYLIFIACSELLCEFVLCYFPNFRTYYYDFFVIPLEFLILFWLYSYKSLANKKLFYICFGVYLISLLPYFAFEVTTIVNSFNYIVGTFLLSIMIILEYNKQMKSDDILMFRENMMFYINTAVGLFYVGTLPYFAFNGLLWKDKDIFYNYCTFFLITNILMYTLFSIALLWGKPNTY